MLYTICSYCIAHNYRCSHIPVLHFVRNFTLSLVLSKEQIEKRKTQFSDDEDADDDDDETDETDDECESDASSMITSSSNSRLVEKNS